MQAFQEEHGDYHRPRGRHCLVLLGLAFFCLGSYPSQATTRRADTCPPLLAPPAQRGTVAPTPITDTPQLFAYRPYYRSVPYLTRILAPLVTGTFVSQASRAGHAQQDLQDLQDQQGHQRSSQADGDNEVILFRGGAADVALIRQVLSQLDTPLADVMAHGVVYEVERHASEGSAFDLVLSLLAGEVSLGLDAGAGAAAVTEMGRTPGGAVLSALASDERFRMLSNPRLRIRSGRSAHFSVGEEVPTLAAIAYPGISCRPKAASMAARP